jgi:DNA-binding response OmpR family regulator
VRVLIIEDEIDLANTIADGLRKQGYAVDVVFDGNVGDEYATVNDYDLLILDLNLPGMDGLETCRRLRFRRPDLLILMVTARSHPNDRVVGLDLGADDYLVKPFDFGELLARVRALLRRDLSGRNTIIQWGKLKLDPLSRTVWHDKCRVELTRKEFGILEYLMRHPGEIISQEKLLEHVWDAEANPFSGSVRVHIHSLRRKLGVDGTLAECIETLVGQGYRLVLTSSAEGAL